MNYAEFVKPELLALIVALYGTGAVIKKSKAIKNKHIPILLGVLGVLLSCLYVISSEGFNAMSLYTGIIQGALCAAGAVFSNQIIKQSKNED